MRIDARLAIDVGASLEEGRQEVSSLSEVRLVHGRRALLALLPMLRALCRRSGQAGQMDSFDYFLSLPSSLLKTPWLILIGLRAGMDPERATADDVQAAVMVYEYRIAGRGAGIFVVEDNTGRRNVLAPPEIRRRATEIACRTLMARGAIAVLIAFQGGDLLLPDSALKGVALVAPGKPCWIARKTRVEPGYLPLESTFEGSLALLGKHTRRNLRYYRRLAEQELGVRFVPQLQIDRETFFEMNRCCTKSMTPDEVTACYDQIARIPNPVFAGIQDASGRWLSMMGGRRQETETDIDWQMNRAGLERYSLSAVMRSYLLEHEIRGGATRMVFEGGTPHSIRHSFADFVTHDLLVRRSGLRAWLLCRYIDRIFPKKNFLRVTLADPDLTWSRW